MYIYVYVHTHTYIYRVSHFNGRTQISRKVSKIKKNVLHKSCKVQRGTPGSDLDSDLGVKFRGHFKVNLIFLNETINYSYHLLTTGIKIFSKHYYKMFFHKVLFELLRLEFFDIKCKILYKIFISR